MNKKKTYFLDKIVNIGENINSEFGKKSHRNKIKMKIERN
jgi:hypothetical protein